MAGNDMFRNPVHLGLGATLLTLVAVPVFYRIAMGKKLTDDSAQQQVEAALTD